MRVVIVIDMQNDFITGSLKNDEALKIVPSMVKFIDSLNINNDFVIATRDTHQSDYLNTNEGKHLPVEHCLENSNGWQIETSILNALNKKNALFINKPTFGLKQDAWANYLKNVSIDEIVLVGVCTDICVVSNALMLKSLFAETPVTVYSNLCAGVTVKTHLEALSVMSMCQVDVKEY